ncbi:hypothetical protein GPECTOR_380g179 [Gonium pectorale]|uniref:Uncharacterized protein n=1 Tax=Gonium pectorale TaxID=33097 RepID=A0A150FVE2_GONPE|nr:hypothetical protein GPECTOR_380g179 [Gonium pectorale]|eukprot:KXZ41582.1 hypothetical protein GPECTOR_380g179 [Gonium pectorale]
MDETAAVLAITKALQISGGASGSCRAQRRSSWANTGGSGASGTSGPVCPRQGSRPQPGCNRGDLSPGRSGNEGAYEPSRMSPATRRGSTGAIVVTERPALKASPAVGPNTAPAAVADAEPHMDRHSYPGSHGSHAPQHVVPECPQAAAAAAARATATAAAAVATSLSDEVSALVLAGHAGDDKMALAGEEEDGKGREVELMLETEVEAHSDRGTPSAPGGGLLASPQPPQTPSPHGQVAAGGPLHAHRPQQLSLGGAPVVPPLHMGLSPMGVGAGRGESRFSPRRASSNGGVGPSGSLFTAAALTTPAAIVYAPHLPAHLSPLASPLGAGARPGPGRASPLLFSGSPGGASTGGDGSPSAAGGGGSGSSARLAAELRSRYSSRQLSRQLSQRQASGALAAASPSGGGGGGGGSGSRAPGGFPAGLGGSDSVRLRNAVSSFSAAEDIGPLPASDLCQLPGGVPA